MSNIYIQEPPTSGKVLLKTTVGDIDIELWSRECPKACRNFIQLCMEGYYNGTIFHRIVKGFIVQGGDPNGDGTGGESIYEVPFKDEFHSRLRFTRRGLVAMANSCKDDNCSQFFFTLDATPELQNKHTLFGKITGDTIFNMVKLGDTLVDHNEKPLYPQKILKALVLHNPFDDIIPRKKKKEEIKDRKEFKEKGVKNFGLLSFGEEAEEDEEETNYFAKKYAGKGKSTHDVLDDPKLSKETIHIGKQRNDSDLEGYNDQNENEFGVKEKAERIKNKLKMVKKSNERDKQNTTKKDDSSDSDDNLLNLAEEEKREKEKKKVEEIRQEILTLKKEYKKDRKVKEEVIEKKVEEKANKTTNEFIEEYITEKQKYSHLKEKVPKKGSSREEFTLELLSKFKSKLYSLKTKETKESKNLDVNDEDIEKVIQTDDWLSHKLTFEEEVPILAKDASTKSDDWYDVFDPRNPLNKRKRGEGASGREKHEKSKV